MIDQDGRLMCNKCHSVILEWVEGRGVGKCPRSNCRDGDGNKTRTFFDTRKLKETSKQGLVPTKEEGLDILAMMGSGSI